MSLIEKSKDMEKRYAEGGNDSWGNRERQLYQKILKKAVELCYEKVEDLKEITVYDVGAGGGNVTDVFVENLPEGKSLKVRGCDISEKAIEFLGTLGYKDSQFDLLDLEEYDHDKNKSETIANSDIVSFVDVMYYFGEKRGYKDTLDQIWKTIKPGAIILVADSLVTYQRRSYLKTKEDCETLYEFTDYTVPVSEEVTSAGKHWRRFLKIKIYKKK